MVRGRQSKSRYGDSWLRRDPLKAFGRAVWQAVIVIYCQLLQVLRRPVETTPRNRTYRCTAAIASEKARYRKQCRSGGYGANWLVHVRFDSNSDRQPSKRDPALRAITRLITRLMHCNKFGEIQWGQIWSSADVDGWSWVSKSVVRRVAHRAAPWPLSDRAFRSPR